MKITEITPPRVFRVKSVEINHCADIELDPEELITFKTESGTEYDIMRKSWGYYATPSISARLITHGFRSVIVKNAENRMYLLFVERGKEPEFDQYLLQEKMVILSWLDVPESINI